MGKKLLKAALIYDFDGTLSPGNMQEYGFIPATGLDAKTFWKKSSEITKEQDASEILCYMKLMVDQARNATISINKQKLKSYGKNVKLFEGVDTWFKNINDYGKKHGIKISHFINSSGLKEIIEGTPIAKYFAEIYACSFIYSPEGAPIWPAVAVDFTAKTQFLFMINKGIKHVKDNKKVNTYIEEDKRPQPFNNMIYFGDGATDIPCMKLVKQLGGYSIAVYNPNKNGKKAIATKLIKDNRVNFVCPANYKQNGEIYKVVKSILDKIKSNNEFKHLLDKHKNKIKERVTESTIKSSITSS